LVNQYLIIDTHFKITCIIRRSQNKDTTDNNILAVNHAKLLIPIFCKGNT